MASSGKNPYIIKPSSIKVNNKLDIVSSAIKPDTINVGYYDDTKIKERISKLEVDVEEIKSVDENYGFRLSVLEGIDHSKFATKDELSNIDRRVTRLETEPVGLKNSEMNEIFN